MASDGALRISPQLHEQFTLGPWGRLSDAERLQLGDYLMELLGAEGWRFDGPPRVERFGPEGEEQSVLQVRDERTRMTFSLVPGGTFQPGYPDELLQEFHQVWALLDAGNLQNLNDPEVLNDPEATEFLAAHAADQALLREFRIPSHYGCGAIPCDIRAQALFQAPPFLMATELLHDTTAEIDRLVVDRSARSLGNYHREFHENPSGPYPFLLDESEIWILNQRYGWTMPLSVELEWAIRGGVGSLFYWGNQIPAWLARELGEENVPAERLTREVTFTDIMRQGFPPERPRRWPWCNRFGLAGTLHTHTWCATSEGPSMFPWTTRGGAAYSYPWQYCREWVSLLTAVERREPADPQARADYRPIVRLVSSDRVSLIHS